MDRKLTDLELIRIKKAEELQKKNINPWSRKTSYSDTSFTLKEKFQSLSNEELEKTKSNVSVMVRIMIKRGPFVVGKDSFGRIQAFVSKKETPQIMSFVHSLDVGDIVFIKGSMMKTHTGELTIRTKELELITKSLKPLPEKFHGLKDVEERYRRRYLDLIMNDHVKETFWTRHKIVALVRKYFDEQNYFAAETPVLHDVLGGANARPFSTHHNALSMDFYLRIATEIPLKKLVVGGFEKVYEIGRLFRNEGIDTSHNPEFTTVEFYQAYSNLDKMMEQTENLFRFVAKGINKKKIVYNNIEIDFAKPFRKVNMVEAINHKTGLDFSKISLAKAREAAKTHKLEVKPYFKLGHIVNLFFEELIEPDLEQPTFIYNYPVEVSPLASRNLKDPRFADRAELFIAGKEYANMFTELNDPFDQMERFESQLKERYSGNDEANEIDLDFIEALEYGMPPTGGCGVGIDRMVMLLTGNHSIREVLLFPHLKHKKGHRQNNG